MSLPDEDVEFLDACDRSAGIVSPSAVMHRAVRLLRASALGAPYEDALRQRDDAGAATDRDAVGGDELSDAAR